MILPDLIVIMLILLVVILAVGWDSEVRVRRRYEIRLRALNFTEAELEDLAKRW